MKHLVLGGVKSGKSRHAEHLAKSSINSAFGDIAVVVTAEPLDDEMRQRIERHKEQRPSDWQVIEAPVFLSAALRELDADTGISFIIVDCLTLWITNLLMQEGSGTLVADAVDELVETVAGLKKPLALVSNETNMGLIGMDALTRKFCDEVGRLHQRLAPHCESVELVVAGIPMKVK